MTESEVLSNMLHGQRLVYRPTYNDYVLPDSGILVEAAVVSSLLRTKLIECASGHAGVYVLTQREKERA